MIWALKNTEKVKDKYTVGKKTTEKAWEYTDEDTQVPLNAKLAIVKIKVEK